MPAKKLLAFLLVIACCTAPAAAWWDTVVTAWRPAPLVKEFEAEALPGVDQAAVVQDAQANGGRGGAAVRLTPGGPGLTTELDLKPGLYALFTIARSPEDEQGRGLLGLEVREHATGQVRQWGMMVAYREGYFASGQMYFPAYAGGRYTVTVRVLEKLPRLPEDPNAVQLLESETLTLKDQPAAPLLVDRLELRDVLANVPKVAAKTRRMLTSDAELAAIRKTFADPGAKTADGKPLNRRLAIGNEGIDLGRPEYVKGRTPDERRKRNDELWAKVPDFNSHVSHHQNSPYGWVIGRDRNGLVADAADAYEKTGHPELGWDGAVLLCALAEKYPALDYWAQGVGGGTNVGVAGTSERAFGFSLPPGKSVYRGWAGGNTTRIVRSYDKLFDFIKDNQELAAYISTRHPWVKTPQDVIELLDSNILQAGIDAINRTYISGNDEPKALIPLVQGVGPVGDKMLDEGIFEAMVMNMTYRGGIDDQAITSYSRDGVHYIGSVGYLSTDLLKIANILHKYRLAGGAARYDLMDDQLYPHMKEAQSTIEQCSAAGGFPFIVGDARDLRVGRMEGYKPYPSRVLGGFGMAIMETGQFGDNPLAMRAVGIRTGLGRGHSHQDTLNLEIMAHGARMAPDLGGRHEGRNHGRPNMRWNKVHNLVEIDERNFENEFPGSTTSGTGWTVAFSAQPGSQFTENHGRATSHPEVSLYSRQTALIDVGPVEEGNSYVFDVFRVAGGRIHTYSFHGAPPEALRVNTPLNPASSDVAKEYLRRHYEGTQQEGVAPAMLEADWPVQADLQKRYQGERYQADRVATTRLSLFGVEGQKVMAGNAWSEAYSYNFPFLYVRGEQEQAGRQSVYPAIIEPFAGQPFIKSKRQLALAPAGDDAAAPVALEVQTTAGTTDLLFAGASGGKPVAVEGKTRASGRYALVSRDADGPRLAHLVGGSELDNGEIAIRVAQPVFQGTIRSPNYPERTFVLDQKLPARLLRGAVVYIGNDEHHESFKLEGLQVQGEQTLVKHEKTAKYYQSRIVNVDSKARAVECEIEPVAFGSDTRFINGTTITNEKGDKSWKGSVELSDRWMNLGWPGYRTSTPNTISEADLVDADGDGRKVLYMIGGKNDKDGEKSLEGQVLLELEVTRITDEGETFYFKLPPYEKYQLGGWDYAYRELVNEDRSRRWVAAYPGSSFLWKLEGDVSAADFTDADGDGKKKLHAFVFGPGDTMRVDASVYVARREPGVFEVRANTPCQIALPRGQATAAQISHDGGRTFRAIESKQDGQRLVLDLSEADLADGVVSVKLNRQ